MSATMDSSVPDLEQEDPPQGDTVSTSVDGSERKDSLAGEALAQAALDDPVAREAIRRKNQSEKDKTADRETKRVLSQIEQIAKRLGVDPEKAEQAQRDIALDEIIQERLGRSDSAPVESGITGPEATKLASSLLESVDERIRNAVIADLNLGNTIYTQVELQKAVVSKLALHASKPKSSAADLLQHLGTTTASHSDADALNARYEELRLQPETPGKREEMRTIQTEIAKLIEEAKI